MCEFCNVAVSKCINWCFVHSLVLIAYRRVNYQHPSFLGLFVIQSEFILLFLCGNIGSCERSWAGERERS